MYRCGSGRKAERAGIRHCAGIQTSSNIKVYFGCIPRFNNKIVHHFAGRTFVCIANAVCKLLFFRKFMMVDQYLGSCALPAASAANALYDTSH